MNCNRTNQIESDEIVPTQEERRESFKGFNM